MKLIVCVKQVPDTSGKVAVNADGTLDRASMQTIINPDDMNAVEAALALKDQLGCPVIAVSMGPPPAAGMLLELKAMGVDKAVLVSAREFGGSDTFATSQILAAAIKNLGVDKDDIIFCGRQAIDGDTLTVRRMLEDGYMTVQVQTPCLLTCIKELNTPRYMTIRGILDCDAEPVTVLDYNALKDDPLIEVDTIGLKGSPTNIYKSFTPPRKGSGMMLEGSGRETVERLFGILSAKHII